MRIDTPDDYVLRSWLEAEQGWKGSVELTDVPDPAPHPNEAASKKRAKAT